VKKDVLDSLEKYGVNSCSVRFDFGTNEVHLDLEKKIADFVGKEAALVFGMGFATNSTGIPSIANTKDTLIISDSKNHTSIILGSKLSKAKCKIFPHNGKFKI
jgi:serine palmitoyltransferase